MRLADDEAHIWYARREEVDDLRAFFCLLDANERGRWSAFRRRIDRDNFLLSRAMLRTALSLYEPIAPESWVFCADSKGRPRIAGPSCARALFFSISHTAGLVAVAIGRTERLGVDVEKIDNPPDLIEIAPNVMTEHELAFLARHPVHRRLPLLLRHWVLKEAFAKACSLGLNLPFNSIGFRLDGFDPRLETDPGVLAGDFSAWVFAELDLGAAHVGAFAAERCHSLCLREWPRSTGRVQHLGE